MADLFPDGSVIFVLTRCWCATQILCIALLDGGRRRKGGDVARPPILGTSRRRSVCRVSGENVSGARVVGVSRKRRRGCDAWQWQWQAEGGTRQYLLIDDDGAFCPYYHAGTSERLVELGGRKEEQGQRANDAMHLIYGIF